MAMPQRDDSPTPRLRRTGTIGAIKRRAAEKKAAVEKKKAEARARAAYRRNFPCRSLCLVSPCDDYIKTYALLASEARLPGNVPGPLRRMEFFALCASPSF